MWSRLPTTLVLVRHGHFVDNDTGQHARLCGQRDVPLSPLGEDQAARLRARLRDEPPVQALYTSPLHRAAQTAAAIAGATQQPRPLRDLQEISCGDLDGCRIADVQRWYPALWQRNLDQEDEWFRWPGGERYRVFRRRVLRAIERIAAGHPGQRVALVTHAGVISQILSALHGLGAARWEAFRPGNTSLTEVEWAGAGGRVLRCDDAHHLHVRV